MKPLAIVLDFDGTVTERDIGDAIVKRFGLPGWDALEERFGRGEVTIRQLWEQEISHLPGERLGEMVAYALEVARVRTGLRELVDFALTRGIPIEVASNGMEFYLRPILESAGLADLPFVCLSVNFDPSRKERIVFPDGTPACVRNGLCKCARVWRLQRQGRQVLFAGDGASDACVASEPDILVARSSLAKLAERNGWKYFPFEDFQDVLVTAREATTTGR